MGSSLRDIPGAGTGRRRGGDRRVAKAVRTPHMPVPTAGPAGRPNRSSGPGRRRSFGTRRSVDRVNLLIALAFVALAVLGTVWLWNSNKVSVTATGIERRETISPQQAVTLAIEVEVSPTTRLGSAVLSFDGEDVTDDANVESTEHGFIWHAPPGEELGNGHHVISLDVKRTIHGTYRWHLGFKVKPTGTG